MIKSFSIQKKHFSPGSLCCLMLIVIISLLIRLPGFFSSSLWTDEFCTLWIASSPTIDACISRTNLTQGMSPFYFIIVRYFIFLFGHNEAALRLISLISSMVSILLIYLLCKKVFKHEKTALLASFLFGLSTNQIYYAQEARPYALGLMFVLSSQIFFINILRKHKVRDAVFYMLFSILACYTHYFMGVILIVQNISYFYCFIKNKKRFYSIPKWILYQAIIGGALLLLSPHLTSLLSQRSSWNWLKVPSFFQAIKLFISMFDPKCILIILFIFLVLMVFDKINFHIFLRINRQNLIILVIWLLTPFIFVYLSSEILGVSFFAKRYLLVSLIPFYLLVARCMFLFRRRFLRNILPLVFIALYVGIYLIPNYLHYKRFAYRVPHNWAGAIDYIGRHYQPGDAILLRTGFVKENWLPENKNETINDYVKCPFRSFYWKHKDAPIYNLTYTYEEKNVNFSVYYARLCKELSAYRRVWIIGVNPPNTNFPIFRVPLILTKYSGMRQESEKNFSGVLVCLMEPVSHR